jgi:hypothetical protein
LLKLHVEGRWLKDELGHLIVLRGVNKPQFGWSAVGNWSAVGGVVKDSDGANVAAALVTERKV